MKVLAVMGKDGVAYHRILSPLAKLADEGMDVTSVPSLDIENDLVELFKGFSCLYLSRTLSVHSDQFEKINLAIQRSGIKLIVDIDDYWMLPASHGLFQFYKDYEIPEKIHKTIKMASAVVVTHPRLADHVYKINQKIVVCPNAINAEHEQWELKQYERASLALGWVGGPQHGLDIDLLRNLCLNLVNEKDIQMVFGGYKEGFPFDTFEFVLTGSLKKENYKRIHAMDIWNYGRMYEWFDIALAPLYRNEFNMCKSELKAIEAGMKGKAFICSDIHPYTLICDKDNSQLVKSERGWYKAVMRYKKNPQMMVDHAAQLHEDVTELRNFAYINTIRKQLIEKVCQ